MSITITTSIVISIITVINGSTSIDIIIIIVTSSVLAEDPFRRSIELTPICEALDLGFRDLWYTLNPKP